MAASRTTVEFFRTVGADGIPTSMGTEITTLRDENVVTMSDSPSWTAGYITSESVITNGDVSSDSNADVQTDSNAD